MLLRNPVVTCNVVLDTVGVDEQKLVTFRERERSTAFDKFVCNIIVVLLLSIIGLTPKNKSSIFLLLYFFLNFWDFICTN